MVNCPWSSLGKSSLPRKLKGTRVTRKRARAPPTVTHGLRVYLRTRPSYLAWNPVSAEAAGSGDGTAAAGEESASGSPEPTGGGGGESGDTPSFFRKVAEKAGMISIAMKYEKIIAKITVTARGAKRNFAMPVRKTTGKKTAMKVRVETSTGVATSRAPSQAATIGVLPARRCLRMFSMMTTAWSTMTPTARAIPPRVITLMVCELKDNPMKVPSTASGTVKRTATEGRKDRRKATMTSAAKTAPIMAARLSSLMALLMTVDWSKTTPRSTGLVNLDWIGSSRSLMDCTIARLFSPGWR